METLRTDGIRDLGSLTVRFQSVCVCARIHVLADTAGHAVAAGEGLTDWPPGVDRGVDRRGARASRWPGRFHHGRDALLVDAGPGILGEWSIGPVDRESAKPVQSRLQVGLKPPAPNIRPREHASMNAERVRKDI